jgi:hypothetical protein
MVTFKAVSDFCKMVLPFLTGAWSLALAYLDRQKRWKLVGSVLSGVLMLAFGFLRLFGQV